MDKPFAYKKRIPTTDGNYFRILFDGEEVSASYSDIITLGGIDGALSIVKNLGNTIEGHCSAGRIVEFISGTFLMKIKVASKRLLFYKELHIFVKRCT